MSSISVVIPTCNDRPEFLDAALRCVIEQTAAAREVIVVNNGSEPLTLKGYPTVQVVEIPRFAGASQARNFGASLATGGYVAFLDDDDLWEKQYLEKVERRVGADAPDCLITRLDKLFGGEIVRYKVAEGRLSLEELLVRNPGASGSSTVVRRSAFFEVSGYDVRLPNGEDKALVIAMLLRDLKVVAAPEIQAILRHHEGARLRDGQPDGRLEFVRHYGRYMTAWQRHHNLAKVYRLHFRASGRMRDRMRARYHDALLRIAKRLGR